MIRPGDVIEIDGTRYRVAALDRQFRRRRSSAASNIDTTASISRNSVGAVTIEAQPINDTGQMLNVEFDSDGRRMRDLVDRLDAARIALLDQPRAVQNPPPADADFGRAVPDARRDGDRPAGVRADDRVQEQHGQRLFLQPATYATARSRRQRRSDHHHVHARRARSSGCGSTLKNVADTTRSNAADEHLRRPHRLEHLPARRPPRKRAAAGAGRRSRRSTPPSGQPDDRTSRSKKPKRRSTGSAAKAAGS